MTTTLTPETSTAPAPTSAAANQTLGIISLVLGVASIVTGFQLIVGVAAIVLGILALRREPTSGKLAVWGIVTGAVSAMGLIWGAIGFSLFLPFAGLAAFSGVFGW